MQSSVAARLNRRNELTGAVEERDYQEESHPLQAFRQDLQSSAEFFEFDVKMPTPCFLEKKLHSDHIASFTSCPPI